MHDRNQFLPAWNFQSGTQCLFLPSTSLRSVGKEYHLKLKETHQLETQNNPCFDGGPGSLDLKQCVINAIMEDMGCTIDVLLGNISSLFHLPKCTSEDQINKYMTAIINIVNHSQLSLFNSTGCKPTCLQTTWIPQFRGMICFMWGQKNS